jgi:two-component system, OmpR family, sensor kinase
MDDPSRRRSPLAWARRWLAGRTLRARLIAGLVALLALACGAVGVVSYAALHRFLLGRLDQQVAAASQRYQACMHPPGPPGGDQDGRPPGRLLGQPGHCGQEQAAGTFTATLDDGVVLDHHLADGACRLTAADTGMLAMLPANGRPHTRTLSSIGAYRLLTDRSQDGILVTGLPVSAVEATLRQVEITEAAAFAVVLMLAAILGTGWVRLSLRPLRRVTSTAAEVAALPLASGEVDLPHRVPDDDPRTEVGQLGASFNRMLGQVESALSRRQASEARLRRFAADASHELRTPLAAIRGYAELARRHPGPVPDDIARALSRLEAESARMSAIVEDLLLLARLDAGRPLASAPVDLTRLAIDVTSDARAAGPAHRWTLELPEEPVLVSGDEHRLHQAIANLLTNARTHTPPGTTVTVTVTAAPGASHPVRLAVTDTGPGIPAALQDGLFERFVRGDSTRSRASGGTGLGLAIVDAIVTAHRGRVTVSSEAGRTSFVIALPALPAQATQGGTAAVRPPAGQAGS